MNLFYNKGNSISGCRAFHLPINEHTTSGYVTNVRTIASASNVEYNLFESSKLHFEQTVSSDLLFAWSNSILAAENILEVAKKIVYQLAKLCIGICLPMHGPLKGSRIVSSNLPLSQEEAVWMLAEQIGNFYDSSKGWYRPSMLEKGNYCKRRVTSLQAIIILLSLYMSQA